MNAESAPSIDQSSGVFGMDPRPWWKRFASRFFHWHSPTPDLPEWAKDGIMTQVAVKFCWKDRLRILLTGNASIRSWTACENPPGRVETTSSAVSPIEL